MAKQRKPYKTITIELPVFRRKRLNRAKVERAAQNLMRLCMQGWAREQLDYLWGAGQTKKHVDELCEVLGIRYP